MSRLLILILILGMLFTIYWYYDKILGEEPHIAATAKIDIPVITASIPKQPIKKIAHGTKNKKKHKRHNLDFIEEETETEKSILTNISMESMDTNKSNQSDQLTFGEVAPDESADDFSVSDL
ncbi:MAG: hypothetical protein Hyperionvirus17_34 [Hyperionvirus sp.]|uniref:Uncharacterized protein n=1 Tax=Hyperionvirus sp. TaxID=2487770 RepID=A0A3G5AC12_9VIRU|nr:MAG: hypothetical protein Hyperionvirus17_34 [Hyperionvirus sp.]